MVLVLLSLLLLSLSGGAIASSSPCSTASSSFTTIIPSAAQLPLFRTGNTTTTATLNQQVFPHASLFHLFVYQPKLAAVDYIFDSQSLIGGVRDTVMLVYASSSSSACTLVRSNDDNVENGFARGAKLAALDLSPAITYYIYVGPAQPQYSPVDATTWPVHLQITRPRATSSPTTPPRRTAFPSPPSLRPTTFPTTSWAPTHFPTASGKIDRSLCSDFSLPGLSPPLVNVAVLPFTIKSYIGYNQQPSLRQAFYCSTIVPSNVRAFRFRAPESGRYAFDTSARLSMPAGGGLAAYDTVIQLLSANSCERLACNDDWERLTSRVEYSLAKHEHVIVMVKAYSADDADFTLTFSRVRATPQPTTPPELLWAPSEPDCSAATTIPRLLLNAPPLLADTKLGRRRKHSCDTRRTGNVVSKTAVFLFTPPSSGVYRFRAASTLLELRPGPSSCGTTSPVACGQDEIQAYLTPGALHYYLLVKNLTQADAGRFAVSVDQLAGSYAPTASPTLPPTCDVPPPLSIGKLAWLDSVSVHASRDLQCGMFLPTTIFHFVAPQAGNYTFATSTNTTAGGVGGDTVVELRESCLEHFCDVVPPEDHAATCEQRVLACQDVDETVGGALDDRQKGEMAVVRNFAMQRGQQVYVLVSSSRLDFSQVGVVVRLD